MKKVLILSMLLWSSCSSIREGACWSVNPDAYQSSIDPSFNYIEDLMDVFPICAQDSLSREMAIKF